MLTNREIIKAAGGADRIAEESDKTDRQVKPRAVGKWGEVGGTIPEVHWGLVIELAAKKGVTLTAEDLFNANRQSRQGRPEPLETRVASA